MPTRSKIACVLAEGFEDSEFRKPYDAFIAAGHEVEIIGSKRGETLKGKAGKEEARATAGIDQARPEDFDALFIPGGYSPDHLRADPRFVQLTGSFVRLGRPVLAVCHGPQLLMSAEVVGKGRTLTAWSTVQGDLKYTGATVLDQPVVTDGNWVTSRQPADLPQFCQASLKLLSEVR
jgi:protease I